MSDVGTPKATHPFQPGGVPATLEFLKRTRSELRMIRKVRVFADRFQVFDINEDYFEIQGLGYADPDVVPILQNLNAAFNPETIHAAIAESYKEFGAGKRYTWAHDRVM
jgi:hypothetical protein